MIQRLLTLCVVAAVVGGCGGGETRPERPVESVKLLIGLIPEQNIFDQLDRYEPLAGYLRNKAGVDIEMRILSRYGSIIDNFVSSELDGAFFGSFTYALAHERLGVEAIARPQAMDGTSTYHGLIFIRIDSGINGVEGLRGKRFVFVDRATTAGYLLPLEFFRAKGINDYSSYFAETYFAGTHEDAIYDVLNRKADIGAAKNTVFGRLAAADPRIANELMILTRSPEVPENALAFRPDLDPAVVARVKQALLTMDRDPAGRSVLGQFGAMRFIETTTEDYVAVHEYAEKVHLDLSTYDYRNQ